ncbi:MAG TPA: hypothetical protein VGE63_02010 [Candidatus Paceibacterota bacterium]
MITPLQIEGTKFESTSQKIAFTVPCMYGGKKFDVIKNTPTGNRMTKEVADSLRTALSRLIYPKTDYFYGAGELNILAHNADEDLQALLGKVQVNKFHVEGSASPEAGDELSIYPNKLEDANHSLAVNRGKLGFDILSNIFINNGVNLKKVKGTHNGHEAQLTSQQADLIDFKSIIDANRENTEHATMSPLRNWKADISLTIPTNKTMSVTVPYLWLLLLLLPWRRWIDRARESIPSLNFKKRSTQEQPQHAYSVALPFIPWIKAEYLKRKFSFSWEKLWEKVSDWFSAQRDAVRLFFHELSVRVRFWFGKQAARWRRIKLWWSETYATIRPRVTPCTVFWLSLPPLTLTMASGYWLNSWFLVITSLITLAGVGIYAFLNCPKAQGVKYTEFEEVEAVEEKPRMEPIQQSCTVTVPCWVAYTGVLIIVSMALYILSH